MESPRVDKTLMDFLENCYVIPLKSPGETKIKMNEKPGQILIDSGDCRMDPEKTGKSQKRVRILTESQLS